MPRCLVAKARQWMVTFTTQCPFYNDQKPCSSKHFPHSPHWTSSLQIADLQKWSEPLQYKQPLVHNNGTTETRLSTSDQSCRTSVTSGPASHPLRVICAPGFNPDTAPSKDKSQSQHIYKTILHTTVLSIRTQGPSFPQAESQSTYERGTKIQQRSWYTGWEIILFIYCVSQQTLSSQNFHLHV